MQREDIFQTDRSGRNPLALEQGTLIRDQFRLGRVLGVGGFGITYLAFDEVLEMVVAVKEYLPSNIAVRDTGSRRVRPLSDQNTSDFEFGLERFLREARMLAKFEEHPNIVRVRTFFEANDTGYLVMNYYEGRTLRKYLERRNGFMLEAEALLVMDQVFDGLAAVHEKDILHRDIDPSNIYLADNGRVVLLDFGAARAAVGERTQDMSVVLKRGYAPYEQYHSQGDQGPWTDVYTCSATLYRMLTGYKPPEATARVLEDELVPPNELVPSLSDATNEAVVEGLAVHPKDRLSSIEALAERLPEPSSEVVPAWKGDGPDQGPPLKETDRAASQLHIQVSDACRLYVDGTRRGEMDPGTTHSVAVTGGRHRLRAVRMNQPGLDSATVTVSESDAERSNGEESSLGLDAVLWKGVVSVPRNGVTSVSIRFGDAPASEVEQDGELRSRSFEEKPHSRREAASSTALEKQTKASSTGGETKEKADGEGPAPLSFLQVEADHPCDLFVDGAPKATLDTDANHWIAVRPGRHRVRAEAIEGEAVWEQDVKSEPNRATTVAVVLDRTVQERALRDLLEFLPLQKLRTWRKNVLLWWRREVLSGLSPRHVRIALVSMVGVIIGSTLLWSALSDAGEVPPAQKEAGVGPIRAQPDRVISMGEAVVDVLANDQGPAREVMSLQSARPMSDAIQSVEVIDASRIRIRPAPDFTGTARVQYTLATVGGTTAQSYVSVGVPFGGGRAVITRDAEGPQVVRSASLTKNDRPDLLIASYDDNTIGWVDNRGQPGPNASRSGLFVAFQSITQSAEGALVVQTADLSGNGRPDILYAAERGGTVAWCENQGDGTFGAPQVITANATGVVSVQAADLTGDGTKDVVVGARRGRRVTWYPNRGQGQFGAARILVQGINQLGDVLVADVTDDAYPDVFVASYQDDTITWYENQGEGEPPQFAPRRLLSRTVGGPIDLHTADLTGNGRQDLLASAAEEGAIVWFANRPSSGGESPFHAARRLAGDVGVIEDLATADLGKDGDQDIVAAGFDSNTLLWIENQRPGAFGQPHVFVRDVVDPVSVALADAEGDGDLDVFSAAQGSDEVAWHENHLR